MTTTEHEDTDIIGGYRRGQGAWLAWYFGALEGSREEEHEAFGTAKAARLWLIKKLASDPDFDGKPRRSWEDRNSDGARLLVVPYVGRVA